VTALKIASTREDHKDYHSYVEVEHHADIRSEQCRVIAQTYEAWVDVRVSTLELLIDALYILEVIRGPAEISEEICDEIPLYNSVH
jgi:hypothetical protein